MVAPLDIKERDYNAAYAQGMSIGEAYRQRKRDDRTREGLGRYLSAGDRTGLDTAYQNDPDAAFKAQQAVQKQQGDAQTVAANFAKAWSAAPPQAKPNLISAARRTIAQRPDLQQVLGDQLPQTDDPTEWDNFLGQGALFGAQTSESDPAGYRQFQLQAEAAGLKPGTPEYQKAAQVALGLEGRASSAGFGKVTFTGADGRERIGVLNGRTGRIDLADGSSFNPQTGQMEQSQPPQQQAPADDGRISPESVPALIAAARANGENITPEQEAMITQQVARTGNFDTGAARQPPQQSAPVQTPVARSSYADTPLDQVGGGAAPAPRFGGGAFVGRTPEEQAALTTAAQERAKNDSARSMGGFEVDLAAQKAAAEAAAKIKAEAETTAQVDFPKVQAAALGTLSVIDKAIKHPGRETATGTSGGIDPRNYIPFVATDAKDFAVVLRQVKGKAFLEAFNSLRGSGAITEKEGSAATDAIGRLDTAQSDSEFLQALRDLRGIVANGYKRAKEKASKPAGAPAVSGGGWSATRVK